MKNKYSVFLLILSLAGFFDSAYLTILHYKNAIPPCSITNGCEIVLTSRFATILGVPIALFGVIFFLALIFLLLLGFTLHLSPSTKKGAGLIKYFKLLTLAGVVVSFVLLYIQAFILHAYCQYCLLVEAIIFIMFLLSFRLDSPAGLNEEKNKQD